jgi:PAB-dependent poly(A)-specific ribonuclease subunit 2
VSLYGNDLQRYTAFKIQPASEGPVRQFLFHERGIIALGSRTVHMALRRGPTIWNIRYALLQIGAVGGIYKERDSG